MREALANLSSTTQLDTSADNSLRKLHALCQAAGSISSLNLIFNALRAGYLKIDRSYVVRDANAIALEWLGMGRDDVVGLHFATLSPRSPMTMLQSVIESTVFIDRELTSYLRPDRLTDLHIYPADEGAILFFRDVTEQKRMEQQALRTKAILQSSLDALSAQVVVLDCDGAILASNQAWQRFVADHGLSAATKSGALNYLTLSDKTHARRADALRIADALGTVLSGRRRSARLVHSWQHDGRSSWFQLSAVRFISDGQAFVVVANEEVTAVKEAQQVLGEVSERLLTLQEEERQRIAEELHDSTAQHLVAIGLNVMGLKGNQGVDLRSRGLLRDIEGSLQEASKELRSFTYLLHPPRLEQDGLYATLQRYVDGYCRRTGIQTILRAPLAIDTLPFPLQRSVFRIVQEGLANVHKHASATHVRVDLRCVTGRLHLSVSDNGRGIEGGDARFRKQVHPARMGVGIPGIRARLQQFGGELVIRSGTRGTRLHAVMPCDGAQVRNMNDLVSSILEFPRIEGAERNPGWPAAKKIRTLAHMRKRGVGAGD